MNYELIMNVLKEYRRLNLELQQERFSTRSKKKKKLERKEGH